MVSRLYEYGESIMMTTAVLENVCRSYQNCHEFLFMNVNALVSSFCFNKFVKIPLKCFTSVEILVMKNTERYKILIEYLTFGFLCYLRNLPAV